MQRQVSLSLVWIAVLSLLIYSCGGRGRNVSRPAELRDSPASSRTQTGAEGGASLSLGEIEVIPYDGEGRPAPSLRDHLWPRVTTDGTGLTLTIQTSPAYPAGEPLYLEVRFNPGRFAFQGAQLGDLAEREGMISFVKSAGPGRVAIAAAPLRGSTATPATATVTLTFRPGRDALRTTSQALPWSDPLLLPNPSDPTDPQGGVDNGSGTVRLELALPGDNNADGAVSFADVTRLVSVFGLPVDGNQVLAADDFNRDGEVGFADVNLLVSAFGTTVAEVRLYPFIGASFDPGSTAPIATHPLDQVRDTQTPTSPRGYPVLAVPFDPAAQPIYAAFAAAGDIAGTPFVDSTAPRGVFLGVDAPTRLAAPAGDPATDHLPIISSLTHPAPLVLAGEPGEPPLFPREFVVKLAPGTTVEDLNQLLAQFGAHLIVAEPGADYVGLFIPSSTTRQQVAETISSLVSLPAVELALPSLAAEPQRLPPFNQNSPLWDWSLFKGYQGLDNPDNRTQTGNWGLMMIRAPQMWNLDTYTRRLGPAGDPVDVVVSDFGFTSFAEDNSKPPTRWRSTHEDLPTLRFILQNYKADHGTAVASIIGADWANQMGIEGVSPWIDGLIGHQTVTIFAEEGENPFHSFLYELNSFRDYIRIVQDVRVFNLSYAISWERYGIIPVQDDSGYDTNGDGQTESFAQIVDALGDFYQRFLEGLAGQLSDDRFVLVAAAGSDPDGRVRDASPVANLSVRVGGRYFSVEAVDNALSRFTFSPTGGNVSAPGVCVRAAEDNTLFNYDYPNCPVRDGSGTIPQDPLYATVSGTSFSTAYVSGLIASLWKLNPNLTVGQIRTLITSPQYTRTTTGGAAPMVDAFAAAMGIDEVLGSGALEEALLDLDDGTDDGNLRQGNEVSPEGADTISTPDRRRGDGQLDMSDFRALRDAILVSRLENSLFPDFEGILFDGPPDHFKLDLNQDGCSRLGNPTQPDHPLIPSPPNCGSSPPREELFARFDLNGNGRVWDGRSSEKAPFKADPDLDCQANPTNPNCKNDFEVFALSSQSDWSDIDGVNTEEVVPGSVADIPACDPDNGRYPNLDGGWNTTSLRFDRDGDGLPDYINSTDIHLAWAMDTGPTLPEAGIYFTSPPDLALFRKCRQGPWLGVITLPLFPASGAHEPLGDFRIAFLMENPDDSTEEWEVQVDLVAYLGEDFVVRLVSYQSLFEIFSTRLDRGNLMFLFEGGPVLYAKERLYRKDTSNNPYFRQTDPNRGNLDPLLDQKANEILWPRSQIRAWLGDSKVSMVEVIKEIVCVDKVGEQCNLYEGRLWGAVFDTSIWG